MKKEYTVQMSHTIYSKATIKARSIDEAWDITLSLMAEGNLEAEYVNDSDTEIDSIVPVPAKKVSS